MHLAAASHANRSNKDPHSTFDHSLRTLENALDNSRGIIDHFIFYPPVWYMEILKKR